MLEASLLMSTEADRPPDEESCCLPGDITVTRTPSGYLVSRALRKLGKGPWWEYVTTTKEYDDAVGFARALAEQQGVRAWWHLGGGEYEPLKDREPNVRR